MSAIPSPSMSPVATARNPVHVPPSNSTVRTSGAAPAPTSKKSGAPKNTTMRSKAALTMSSTASPLTSAMARPKPTEASPGAANCRSAMAEAWNVPGPTGPWTTGIPPANPSAPNAPTTRSSAPSPLRSPTATDWRRSPEASPEICKDASVSSWIGRSARATAGCPDSATATATTTAVKSMRPVIRMCRKFGNHRSGGIICPSACAGQSCAARACSAVVSTTVAAMGARRIIRPAAILHRCFYPS